MGGAEHGGTERCGRRPIPRHVYWRRRAGYLQLAPRCRPRPRPRPRARALGEAHGQTAGPEQESEQESEEELGAEPGPPPSSSGRSGFASRIKTNVQTQGTRLNVRRQGSFSRKPVTRAGADVDSNEALSAEQAAVAFQAAFQADGGTARD